MTKAELQAEIVSLQAEILALKRHQTRLIDQREEAQVQLSTLITQDNALLHLLNEMLNIEVHAVETPKHAWENEKVIWGFFQLPDGEELHRNESLVEGYRAIWGIEQEVGRMRKENEGR